MGTYQPAKKSTKTEKAFFGFGRERERKREGGKEEKKGKPTVQRLPQ